MKTYIIGHQKPDLDSVVSAMAVAEFRLQRGDPNTPLAVLADPANPETQFVFNKFNLSLPPVITAAQIGPDDKIVLVDHNETEQRLAGINPNAIDTIVDHHKFNLNLNQPIKITALAVGSTTTIVWLKFQQYGLKIPTDLAKLMLAAVLSDTVGLKSATTTGKDRACIENLAQTTNITNIDELTLEIFRAKSNIKDLTPEQIVKNDYKIFDFAKKTFIGQIETVEQEAVIQNRAGELLTALNQVKQAEGVRLAFLAVSDILKVNTKLLLAGDEETAVAQKAFGSVAANNILDIGPKLSRKKEIAPPIEKAI